MLMLWGQRSFAPPSGLPAISPSGGEIGGFTLAASPATMAIGEGRGDG
jgi:hypothetical protein